MVAGRQHRDASPVLTRTPGGDVVRIVGASPTHRPALDLMAPSCERMRGDEPDPPAADCIALAVGIERAASAQDIVDGVDAPRRHRLCQGCGC